MYEEILSNFISYGVVAPIFSRSPEQNPLSSGGMNEASAGSGDDCQASFGAGEL